MRRLVLEDVKLSDGTTIRKNQILAVSNHSMWDARVHEDPERWDGYRFYRMRETPGKENAAHLVSTGADHLAFGHGHHACPGRFFAANETKIGLIYLLMKYDWRLPDGAAPKPREFGFTLVSDPTLVIETRRRNEEIKI